MIKQFSFLLIILVFAGCSKSVVYSPSLTLPSSTLKEKAIDFSGGLELMPEVRPEELSGRSTTFGAQAQIVYGFGEKFSLGAKAWFDIEHRENMLRSGYSLNAYFTKELSETSRLIYIPRAAMVLSSNDISGYGFELSSVYQKIFSDKISIYVGPGLIWGFRYLEKERNAAGIEKLPMGFAIKGNLGFSGDIGNALRVNCEVNPIYQINTFDDNQQFVLAPTIALGYTIGK